MPETFSQQQMQERLVRYAELRPCTTAFIDTRTPGSEQKENFTIIGPGVSENPDQHVHIRMPHGFNIGAARQPPGCVNSQHAHETAEVFVVHSGTWAFRFGVNAEDGEVILTRGDTISIPVEVFRGFENVGEETGFLFAVLGGDDPGKVTWAPYVFDMAKEYGLILLENGRLLDTRKGEEVPAGEKPQKATTVSQAKSHRRMTLDEMLACVAPEQSLMPSSGSLGEAREIPVIGRESQAESVSSGSMSWPHGFHLRRLELAPGKEIPAHARLEEEVIFVHQGSLSLAWDEGRLLLSEGDVITLPKKLFRSWKNSGPDKLLAYVVRGSDSPRAPVFV